MNSQAGYSARLWVCGLSGALFVLDLFVPLGVANGVLYSGVVLLAYLVTTPAFALMTAVAGSALALVGGVLSPIVPGVPVWLMISNRVFSVLAIWVPVLFFVQRHKAEQALQQAHDESEAKVHERTAELVDVNRALVTEISERMETERALRASEVALQASKCSLHQSSEELHALAARLLTAQEEDRRRISRDLHDDINQQLAMISVDLESLWSCPPASQDALGRTMRSIQDRINEVSDDIRRIVHQVHPSVLDDLGLPIALKQLLEEFSSRTGLKSAFQYTSLPTSLSRDLAICLYRIAQECLSNVVRHAEASSVEMALSGTNTSLTLSITDDGKGFDDPKAAPTHAGLGLVSMKERVRLVGGTVEITSAGRKGTTVKAWVPIAGGWT